MEEQLVDINTFNLAKVLDFVGSQLPTQSFLQQWLRREHYMDIWIPLTDSGYDCKVRSEIYSCGTDSGRIFETYEEASQLIPFKVASMIIQPEKADISSRLLQIYETDLVRLVNRQTQEPSTVQTVFSI